MVEAEVDRVNGDGVLTRNSSRISEASCHFRIHLNCELLFFNDGGVSLVNLLTYPGDEWLACNCGKHIANPDFGDFSQLIATRKVIVDLCIVIEMRENLLKAEVIIGRNTHMNDMAHFNVFDLSILINAHLHFF